MDNFITMCDQLIHIWIILQFLKYFKTIFDGVVKFDPFSAYFPPITRTNNQCFKNQTGPAGPTSPTVDRSPFRSGPVIWTGLRSNRRFNRWIGRTGRFQGNRPIQIILIFWKKKYKIKLLPSHYKHERKDSILGLSYDTTHIPTPITVGFFLSPQDHVKPLLRMAFIGVIWLLVPLSCRCGIAKYQRKKT